MSVKSVKKPDFEKEMKQLEKLLDEMENEELSLEESIRKFEQGVKMVHKCQQALDQAERKIKVLMKKNSRMELDDYPADQD